MSLELRVAGEISFGDFFAKFLNLLFQSVIKIAEFELD